MTLVAASDGSNGTTIDADAVDVGSNKNGDPQQCRVGSEMHAPQARAFTLTVRWAGGKKGGHAAVLHGEGTQCRRT